MTDQADEPIDEVEETTVWSEHTVHVAISDLALVLTQQANLNANLVAALHRVNKGETVSNDDLKTLVQRTNTVFDRVEKLVNGLAEGAGLG